MVIKPATVKHLPPLTGIRFIAVVMIFLFHYNVPAYGKYLQAAFHQFFLGVTVFFVLSGFLICYNYGKGVNLNKAFLKKYYTNRAARIIPLYFLLLTFTFIVFYIRGEGGDNLLALYLINISFLKGYSAWYMFTGIFPAWSLTPEVTFYVLFPFMYILATRFNWWWQQVVAFWVMGLLLFTFFHFFPFRGFFKGFHFFVSATFFCRCFEFILGMKLACWFRNWQLANEKRNTPASGLPSYTLGGALICLLVIVAMAIINPNDGAAVKPGGWVLAALVFPVGVALLLFGLLTESSWLGRLLSTAFLQVLGKSAYAFFLVHAGVISEWLLPFWNDNQLLFFISVTLLSIALYYLIEKPMNKWIKIPAGNAGSGYL
jgi:peptidoglycan/LPS O-acetylase OafA/YrhL